MCTFCSPTDTEAVISFAFIGVMTLAQEKQCFSHLFSFSFSPYGTEKTEAEEEEEGRCVCVCVEVEREMGWCSLSGDT